MKLSEQQIRHFNTFGYIGVKNAFSPAQTASIIEEFEYAFKKMGATAKHDGTRRVMLGAPIEHSPKQCALLDDPVVTGIIGSVIGDDFNYCSGDGNYYVGDTPWHPDGDWGRLFAIKLAFYLDPVTKDTGCLRVIPGSQDPNYFLKHQTVNGKPLMDPNNSKELFGVEPRDFPGNVPLETNPGDLVMFNHDTWHAAYGGGNRRRMFTMNCTRRAKTPEDVEMLRKYLSIHSAGGYKKDTGGGMYLPMMLDTATPQRWKHLEQAAKMHDELFPQYARNRDVAKYGPVPTDPEMVVMM